MDPRSSKLSLPPALATLLERFLSYGIENAPPEEALTTRRGRGFGLIALVAILLGGVLPSALNGATQMVLVALAVFGFMVGGLGLGLASRGRLTKPIAHTGMAVALWGIVTAGIGAENGDEVVALFPVLLILVSTYVLGVRAAFFWTCACIVGVSIVLLRATDAPPDGSFASGPPLFAVRSLLLLAVFALAAVERRFADRQSEELYFMARHDSLTGLYNRRALDERLQEGIERARRHGRRLAVIVMDRDGFKGVNDRDGHEAGDVLLRCLGQRIAERTRSTDTSSRIGGDEFAVLLEDLIEDKQAQLFAERLLASLTRPVRSEGFDLQIKASVGIAAFPDAGVDPKSVLRAADLAMYEAKVAGGGISFPSASWQRTKSAASSLASGS
jgi:diguanylate cyclase (GGDEF)-like protein